ncbi:MAG: hypothetical protein K0R09_3940 [Clostridiales bacterium]|jgi:hypothetical protein|nr:hypothetical protein [Clostridiales bacterium]
MNQDEIVFITTDEVKPEVENSSSEKAYEVFNASTILIFLKLLLVTLFTNKAKPKYIRKDNMCFVHQRNCQQIEEHPDSPLQIRKTRQCRELP